MVSAISQINQELGRVVQLRANAPHPTQTGDDGGGPHMIDMERVSRIEGEIDGLKHGHNMLLGGLGLVGAIIVVLVSIGLGIGVYELQRLDQLSERVNALPGQISSDLRDITKTLAESITSAKQQPPQVIIMPAPQEHPNTQK